jgi:nitrogen fixation protein NifB
VGEKIYPWVRFNKRVYRGIEAAEVLIKRQLDAVKKLKENGITVKINSIVIPGVNDHHIEEIAKTVSELGADILNALPIFPTDGTMFEDALQPDVAFMQELRTKISEFIPQMHHCTRCRADAVGILGEKMKEDDYNLLLKSSLKPAIPGDDRPYVAVASMEGLLVNRHLGESGELFIYKKSEEDFELIERRKTPDAGGGIKRWKDLAEILSDCNAIFLSGIGVSPKTVLSKSGIKIIETEGLITDVLEKFFKGKKINIKAKQTKCGQGCSGSGLGCG